MNILFLLFFTMLCSLRDLSTGKIPNSFILCGFLCGLVSSVYPEFHPGGCLLGFLIPLLLFYIPFLLGMIGGGDIKLLAVTGLFLGARMEFQVILYSLLIGAFMSLIIMVCRRNMVSRFRYFADYIRRMISSQNGLLSGRSLPRITSYRGPGTEDGEFCFSVPVFLSLVYLTVGNAL